MIVYDSNIKQALIALARRRLPSVCHWTTIENGRNICLICMEKINGDWDKLIKHGLRHLKEHNLLVFL